MDQLSEKQIVATLLVAQDRLPNKQIADRCGISERTLDNWKTKPLFKRAVEDHLNAWMQQIHRKGIADRRRRIFQLNERWRKAQAIVQACAKDPEMRALPGGATGFIRKRIRAIPIGNQEFDQVTEFFFDAKLYQSLARIEEQAARELGQWDQKQERTIRRLSDLSREETDALLVDIHKTYGIPLPA